ncbi:MAG: tripartite tricarboxylate transporter permease [Deltaproteobacteria bacterium]
MDILSSIVSGFGIAFQWDNLLLCFIGVLFGTFTGVLPGFGPSAAIALLIPLTTGLSGVSSIILLCGIYYGAMYGGSTTSILVNIPGEAASVITCLDGYQMAQAGRAGPALGISAFGSLIGGTIGIIGLMFIAPPLADFALKFGAHEIFSIMFLGLTVITYVSQGPVLKSLMMASLGLMLSSAGMDIISGTPRLTFGILDLQDGIPLVPLAMGLFGISEVLLNLETKQHVDVYDKTIRNILPTLKDWSLSIWAILRGSGVGFFCGLIPGAGPVIASFISYAVEKKVSKHPERFGKGAIEGVAGPESANNAAVQAAFIPLFTLGIPVTPAIAILFGAFVSHGIVPGPMLISKHPDLFWGVIASMYLGNIMLMILNLPLINLWVRIVRIPYVFLFPLILLFCLIGAFSLDFSMSAIYFMCIFGVVGYVMKKFEYEPTPLIMGFILGPLMEKSLRQALIISQGKFMSFLDKPICVVALSLAAILLITNIMPHLKGKRPAVGSGE